MPRYKQMYILIVNEDPLGRSLAEILVKNGHEIAYLDTDVEYCNQIAAELGCLVVHGDTTNINVLQEAGIERADVVIALHQKDIKNIMVGIFARQFGVPQIMARLRQALEALASLFFATTSILVIKSLPSGYGTSVSIRFLTMLISFSSDIKGINLPMVRIV